MEFVLSSEFHSDRTIAYSTRVDAIRVVLVPDVPSECAFILERSSVVWLAETAAKSPVGDIHILVGSRAVLDHLICHEQRRVKL